MAGAPRVTVVTVVRNNAEGLIATARSVRRQTYADTEYVVVDGQSTDETVHALKNMANLFDVLISEPDDGIFDAMNKGARHASGDWCYFLNGGDVFADDDVLADVVSMVVDADDIIHGDCINSDTGEIHRFKPDHLHWAGMTFDHPAALVRSSICKAHPFQQAYKVGADFHFFALCRIMNKSFHRVERVFCKKSYVGGNSDDVLGRMCDRYMICRNLFPSKPIEDQLFGEMMLLRD